MSSNTIVCKMNHHNTKCKPLYTKQKHAQTEVCRQYAKAVFWYLLASAIIHYYNLQILLLSVSYQYSVLNKVVVCHVEGVEK